MSPPSRGSFSIRNNLARNNDSQQRATDTAGEGESTTEVQEERKTAVDRWVGRRENQSLKNELSNETQPTIGL